MPAHHVHDPRHYNIHEAKTRLSSIIQRVENGEEIVIDRAGHPVAKVIPFPKKVQRHGRGSLSGKIHYAHDWDSPEVNQSIAREFEE
jgi:prevent-host-death family protein